MLLVGGEQKDHFEITDTPLTFRKLDEIKRSAHSKVKRED